MPRCDDVCKYIFNWCHIHYRIPLNQPIQLLFNPSRKRNYIRYSYEFWWANTSASCTARRIGFGPSVKHDLVCSAPFLCLWCIKHFAMHQVSVIPKSGQKMWRENGDLLPSPDWNSWQQVPKVWNFPNLTFFCCFRVREMFHSLFATMPPLVALRK